MLLIGEGHFTNIYLFVHDNQIMVLKQSKKKTYDKWLKNEVNVIRKAGSHPNIIKLIESYKYGIVLECCSGDLFSYMECNKMTDKFAQRVCLQLSTAIAYLHNLGITHRDIKPENVFIYYSNKKANIKLGDFGLSSSEKYMNEKVGTLSYTAPEVINGETYTSKVDDWSFGVFVYTILGGYNPFDPYCDISKKQIEHKICSGLFSFSHHIWTHVSNSAKVLIQSLLVVDQNKRTISKDYSRHVWFQEDTYHENMLYTNKLSQKGYTSPL